MVKQIGICMIVTIPERSDEMKNCIITGGNSGIGFQAAKQIAEKDIMLH